MKVWHIKLSLAFGLLLLSGCVDGHRVITKREPLEVSVEDKQLDALRREQLEKTTWGRAETKPWNERFRGYDSNRPFQGTAEMNNRRPEYILNQ